MTFPVAAPCTQGSEVVNFSVAPVPCHATFSTNSKIRGVVNNDLILFSMVVIYFEINILVYFFFVCKVYVLHC